MVHVKELAVLVTYLGVSHSRFCSSVNECLGHLHITCINSVLVSIVYLRSNTEAYVI